MTKHNDKSGSPLQPTKTSQTSTNGATLHAKLTALDQQLTNLLHSQHFYRQALINLLDLDNEPSSLIGALVIHQWLEQSGDSLLDQLKTLKKQQ